MTRTVIPITLESWCAELLADPVTKAPCGVNHFPVMNGVPDARVLLKNSSDFSNWQKGQEVYEEWEATQSTGAGNVHKFLEEIEYDRPVYENLKLTEPILDVGGGVGTVREFIHPAAQLMSIDPHISSLWETPDEKIRAYTCLRRPLNFLCAVAEFLPVRSATFSTIHMRSMLDHVQIPELAVLEAHRVLKPGGSVVVGLSVAGPPYGRKPSIRDRIQEQRRMSLEATRKLLRLRHDAHMWHPTPHELVQLFEARGFEIGEMFWQPKWRGRVVYFQATKM